MFAVVVTLQIHPEKIVDFMPLVQANATASVRDEAGCYQFDVATDPGRMGEVFLYELYEDAAAFEHHKTTAHFTTFDREIQHMVANKHIVTYAQVAQ